MLAVVAAAASVAGSVMAGKSQQKAMKQQMEMQRQAQQFNREMVGKGETALTPYNALGQKAYESYAGASGSLGPEEQKKFFDNFTGGPYAEDMRKNLEESLTSAAAARGSAYGGNFYNALYKGNADLYNNALNNQMNWMYQGIQPGLAAGQSLAGLYGAAMGSNTSLTNSGMNALGEYGKSQANMYSGIGNTVANTIGGAKTGSLSLNNIFDSSKGWASGTSIVPTSSLA